MSTVTHPPDSAGSRSDGFGVIMLLLVVMGVLGVAMHLVLSLHAPVPPLHIRSSVGFVLRMK